MHREVLVADPAPLVLAHLTDHVGAAALLFYPDKAVLTVANYGRVGLRPLLIVLVYLILTLLVRVPGVQTLEAVLLFAVIAYHC